jgi:hypothetical protein
LPAAPCHCGQGKINLTVLPPFWYAAVVRKSKGGGVTLLSTPGGEVRGVLTLIRSWVVAEPVDGVNRLT